MFNSQRKKQGRETVLMKEPTTYISVDEAARRWKVSPKRIIYTCESGGIEGAAKLSGQWIIPAALPRPTIKQLPTPVQKQPGGNKKRTSKHQAFINVFEGDGIPFNVSEYKTDKCTYIVTSCYSKQTKRTAAEAVASWRLRCLEREGYLHTSASERGEIMRAIRDDEIRKQPSLPEYLEQIEKALIKMEFPEEDIAMLLVKYAEAYKPLT